LVQALAGARSSRTAGGGTDDDVLDRINRPVEVHEEAGELIAAALLPILRRIADSSSRGRRDRWAPWDER